MPRAGEELISLKEAAKRVLQFCSAKEAGPVMEPAVKNRRIRIVGWRRIQGQQTPIPDTDAFFAACDPESEHTVRFPPQFPWSDDALIREVHDAWGLLHSSVVWGPLVLWSEVVAEFRTYANLELPDTQEEETPAPSQDVHAPEPNEPTDSSHRWVLWRIAKAVRDNHIEGRPLPSTKTELSEKMEPLLRQRAAELPNSSLRPVIAHSIEVNYLRHLDWPPFPRQA